MSNQTTSTPPRTCWPTHRQFLVNCSAVAVTVAVAPGTLALPSWERQVPLDRLSGMNFARQLNTAFLVRLDHGAAMKLQLIEVSAPRPTLRSWPPAEDSDNEKFALLFRGPLAPALAQDTHAFEHHQLGRFGMFIVPIGCNDQTQWCYEAIFNRPPGGAWYRTGRMAARRRA